MTAARRLAASMTRRAVRAAQTDPVARGADWRLATVQTINSGGTIVTADGITARRISSYATPLVGDLIVITQSGSGNWVALGRTASSTATWQTPSLGTGWATGPSGGTVQACEYRIDAPQDDLIIAGSVHSTSTTPASTIFTVAAGFAPKNEQRDAVLAYDGTNAVMHGLRVTTAGAVILFPNISVTNVDIYFQVRVPLGNIP